MQFHISKVVILAGLGFGLGLSSATQASEVVYTGKNGRSVTSEVVRDRTETGTTIQRTTTLPSGKTSRSTGTFSKTTDNGGYSGTVTHTNRNGSTTDYQIQGQRSISNGSYQNSGTVTGFQGQQATYETTGTYGNGKISGDRTVTYPSGKTRSMELEGQRTGRGSYSGNVSHTGRTGKTRTSSFQRSR